MLHIELNIKKVTQADVENLQDISKKTFVETFSQHNTKADMSAYLHHNLSIKKIQQEINQPQSAFYFALYRNQIIGYLKINTGKAPTEMYDKNALEIERIYVLKQFHGKKVGPFLLDYALQLAREKKVAYLWLGVWEKNERALHFYQKNGFTSFDQHIFKLGTDEQTDILMKLNL
ncbi:MAG: GNAT family N-acetyltransferase [Bacteroidetes bacterium]|nr:GNAT family N-acetyltransferase [Bacteroidota bacterium]